MKTLTIVTYVAAATLACMLPAAYAQGGPQGGPRPGGRGPMMPPIEMLDANGDGGVTVTEFFDGMDKMNQERFGRMDANADGILSKEEVAAMPGPGGRHGQGPGQGQGRPPRPEGDAQGPPPPPPDAADGGSSSTAPQRPIWPPRPEQWDSNGDGSVTFEEFCAAWDKFNQAQFNRVDANADGVLSTDELAKAQRPGPPPGAGRGGQGRMRPQE